MITSVTRTQNPTSWLGVTRAQMETQLARSTDYESTETDNLIAAATQWVQEQTQRSIVATGQASDQQYTITLDRWPTNNNQKAIYLPYGPVSSISSFTYLDSAGSSQSMVSGTNYTLNNPSGSARPFITYISSWPSLYSSDYRDKITIVYTVGESSVPVWAQQAILSYGTFLKETDKGHLDIATHLCRLHRIHFDWKIND